MKPEVLQFQSLPPKVSEILEQTYTIHKLWEAADRSSFLQKVGPSIRGLATGGVSGASAALIDALPKLEIIAVFGVGYDAVDLDRARTRKIVVTNTPDVLTEDVADMALGLMLAVARKLVSGDRFVRERRWLKERLPLGAKFSGKRVGIVGFGRIGSAIARRVEGFGCSVSYCDVQARTNVAYRFHRTPAELARDCDFLVCAAAGGSGTHKLIDAKVLEALGPKGVFINISRGSVVDEEALVAALVEKRIAGAGLDVFYDEPNVPPVLFDLDHVVLQPHQASGTVETRWAMGELMLRNLEAHFAGKPVPTPVL
jgi:hydroxypyruvate reductase